VNLYGNPPSSLDDDFFFDLQYGHDDVNAPEAWNAGYRGAGVQVAVLDGGFDLDHPDLEPNINFGLSKNFVAGESLWFAIPGFSHGSHVAGTIAGADNGFGIIGVAPEAELVLVKVLSDGGSGSFTDVVSGIIYAADVGVDVISMSLGAYLPGFGVKGVSPQDILELVKLLDRAILYAYNKGATVIASAGNGAAELSRSGLIHIPSDASKAICISATTAVGWATGMGERDVFASYSNYGLSVIDLAAPGGDDQYSGGGECTIGFITVDCWVFDLIFSASSNLNPALASYTWAAGTSMAVPHVSGVAALIIGKNGGSMNPGSVEAKLKASATDLGKPGRDAYFGYGRVDAYKAVTK
jgi:lantibiotic leader peptide-processing serine protease